MNKSEARKYAMQQKNRNDKEVCSVQVVEDILKSGILNEFQHIGLYYPIGYEMDIISLMKSLPDKEFYLPITKKELAFVSYRIGDILRDGPFHTKEPLGEEVLRDKIECFLIPCVAVSLQNKRIGYGKGFYDRYLENYTGMKLGVCYRNCYGIDVECDTFDVELDYVFLGG